MNSTSISYHIPTAQLAFNGAGDNIRNMLCSRVKMADDFDQAVAESQSMAFCCHRKRNKVNDKRLLQTIPSAVTSDLTRLKRQKKYTL